MATLQEPMARAGAQVEVAPELPVVRGNQAVLLQVVSNLLSNAIKFGGSHPRIRLSAHVENRMATLIVADEGIGIDPTHHEQIFRVFERLHGSEEYPGTGIGLAIVRTGIERMGGTVGVDSQRGEGSRFWFTLPAAEQS
jgi:signal transduction histidine kinase